MRNYFFLESKGKISQHTITVQLFFWSFSVCSHAGFLPKFVKRLKDINFLREDLVFSVHSEEVISSAFRACPIYSAESHDIHLMRPRVFDLLPQYWLPCFTF